MVKDTSTTRDTCAISVPHTIFPGPVQALHIQLGHLSRAQLNQILARHYYSPGHHQVVEDITKSCTQCISLKLLPKVPVPQHTTPRTGFAKRFSADVIKRAGQIVLVINEDLTNYTWTKLLEIRHPRCLRRLSRPHSFLF